MSAIAVSEGKVYVADSNSDQIQVFRFYPKGLVKEERIFLTTSAFPPPGQTEEKSTAQDLAKAIALQQAIKEFAIETGRSPEEVESSLRVERVETLSTGAVQVTVSFPKTMVGTETPTTPSTSGKDQQKKSEEFILQ
jgi:hypothetical protein